MNFFEELKRRNVIKAALSYLVISWLILQVGDLVFPLLSISKVFLKILFYILLSGFIPWVIFAYIYELTPDGFKKTDEVNTEHSIRRSTSKKLNAYIIAGLSLAVIVLVFDRFFQVDVSLESEVYEENSLAVLPFENLSESEDAYFARGITEDIFIEISSITDFKVLSSYKLKDYDANGKSLREIGDELGVTHILLGNIRRSEDDVRIGCQLISTREESALWAQSFDKKMSGIFSLQKEIALEIARSLSVAFTEEENQVIETPTDNLVAYDLVLRARDFTEQHQGNLYDKAAELLKEAIDLDPMYAKAHSDLAFVYLLGRDRFGMYTDELLDSAKALAQKAIDLKPEYSGGWNALGAYYSKKGMQEQALTMFLKTVELNRTSSAAINNLANIYGLRGEIDKAVSMYKRAINLSPANDKGLSVEYVNLGWNYFYLDMFEESIECGNKALEIRDNYFIANLLLSLNYYLLNDSTKNMEYFQKYVNESKPYINGLSNVASLYYEYLDQDSGLYYLHEAKRHPDFNPDSYRGNLNVIEVHHLLQKNQTDSAQVLIENSLNFYLAEMERGIRFENYYYNIAALYAMKNDKEKATEWIQKLIDSGYRNRHTLRLSLFFDNLRDHPPFMNLQRKQEGFIANMREKVIDDEATEQLREIDL